MSTKESMSATKNPLGMAAASNKISLAISWDLEIEDPRIKNFFLQSQKTRIVRISWTCLLYNVFLTVLLVAHVGFPYFRLANLSVLCLTNGTAILATILSYTQVRWIHAVGPLVIITQLAPCLQTLMFDLGLKTNMLITGSFIVVYCLVLFTMTTKWSL